MTKLHKMGARLRVIGRCVLVGMLTGMLATQAVAVGAAPVSQKTPAMPETASVPSGSRTEQISLATTVNLPLTPAEGTKADLSALPDAPTAMAGTSDSASLAMPPELKAMMNDAVQNAQNVQPAPAKKSHGLQRPGMLIMGIVGIPLVFIGVGIYSINTNETSKKIGVGSAFFVPGALMSGFGFYLAFKPKQ